MEQNQVSVLALIVGRKGQLFIKKDAKSVQHADLGHADN
jgi:hypothetical protein